jgi:subtilisin family serine protease
MTDNDLQTSRRSTLKLASGAAVGGVGAGTAAATDDQSGGETADDGRSQWVLRLDETAVGGPTAEDARLAAQQAQQPLLDTLGSMPDVTVQRQFWLANAVLVSADRQPDAAEAELAALSGVRDVHPNVEIPGPEPVEQQHLVPQDHGQYTYGLEQINAPDVWEQFDTTGEGVSVAVLDTGVDPDHPDIDLAENGWAFFDGDGNEVDREPFDPNGHGTHVSGTVAGGSASGAHIGVAPGVDLYNAKVLDDGGTYAQIVAGMEWAVDNGVDVINMSLGATGYFDAYIEPVQNAIEMGTLVVTSAGNSGSGSSGSPGNVYDSFSIGASNAAREVAGFSSGELVDTDEAWDALWLTGEWPINYYVPDVSAPGVSVLSSYTGGGYARLSGTSMASPHTAGAVALLLSADDGLSIEDTQAFLETTARHGGGPDAVPGPRYGQGIIDALSAAAAATDGNVVEGTVTDADGQPVAGAAVETTFGTSTETGADGSYRVYVADGQWDLTVDEFGFQTATETVDVSGGETVTQDVTLDPAVDVAPLSGQADVMGLNETFKFSVRVANLEALTITATDATDVDTNNMVVVVENQTVGFGETVTFPEPVNGEVQITVGSQNPGTGAFGLVHEFDGPSGPLTVETGPTEVMSGPDDAFFEIVDWGQTAEVELGGTLREFCVVENTGDRTATQNVTWWLGDPEGVNVFPTPLSLQGGERAEVPFPILIPQAFEQPGAPEQHGWVTEDDSVSIDARYAGPGYSITSVSSPTQVPYGETLEADVTLLNFGNREGGHPIQYGVGGNTVNSTNASAAPGETTSLTFEFDTTQVVRGQYVQVVASLYDSETAPVQIGSGGRRPPAVVGNSAPQDLDGDGTYEDVDGDGEFTVRDVQLLFQHRDDDAVRTHADAFNFAGADPERVTLADVQAHFEKLREWEG